MAKFQIIVDADTSKDLQFVDHLKSLTDGRLAELQQTFSSVNNHDMLEILLQFVNTEFERRQP